MLSKETDSSEGLEFHRTDIRNQQNKGGHGEKAVKDGNLRNKVGSLNEETPPGKGTCKKCKRETTRGEDWGKKGKKR